MARSTAKPIDRIGTRAVTPRGHGIVTDVNVRKIGRSITNITCHVALDNGLLWIGFLSEITSELEQPRVP
jgi:hypothetical protein